MPSSLFRDSESHVWILFTLGFSILAPKFRLLLNVSIPEIFLVTLSCNPNLQDQSSYQQIRECIFICELCCLLINPVTLNK